MRDGHEEILFFYMVYRYYALKIPLETTTIYLLHQYNHYKKQFLSSLFTLSLTFTENQINLTSKTHFLNNKIRNKWIKAVTKITGIRCLVESRRLSQKQKVVRAEWVCVGMRGGAIGFEEVYVCLFYFWSEERNIFSCEWEEVISCFKGDEVGVAFPLKKMATRNIGFCFWNEGMKLNMNELFTINSLTCFSFFCFSSTFLNNKTEIGF